MSAASASIAPRATKWKGIWPFVFGVCVGVALTACAGVAYIAQRESRHLEAVARHPSPQGADTANAFLAALSQNDIATAYELTSVRFKAIVSEKALAEIAPFANGARIRDFELPSVPDALGREVREFSFGPVHKRDAVVTVVGDGRTWRVAKIKLFANAHQQQLP